jgi:co-chaperonin GroES (HSP10)
MKPRYTYLIKPVGSEYNNTKKVGDQELTINSTIENAKYVNRIGKVVATPDDSEQLKPGDLVVVHHNVFRTYLDMKGRKRKSNEYFRDENYLVSLDRIYLYKRDDKWRGLNYYCFVKPVEYRQESEILRTDKEEQHTGIIAYSNDLLEEKGIYNGDSIGFTKNSEYEFEIDGEKLYRMLTKDICLTITEKE